MVGSERRGGEGGLATGISVVPVGLWAAPSLASSAGTVGEITGGRFTLGIGSGGIHSPAYRQTLGLPDLRPLGTMRDYLTTLRALLAGETVTYEGTAVTLREFALGFKPPQRAGGARRARAADAAAGRRGVGRRGAELV